METITPENTIIHNYTEHGLINKKGKEIELELRGEVYENPIHRGAESYEPTNSQVLIIEIREDGKYVVGQTLYQGKITPEELKLNVKEIKESPVKFMWEQFAKEYTV